MKDKIKELIMPVIVLTLIATVMTALLGGTNLLTKDRIEVLTAKSEAAAAQRVIKAKDYEKGQMGEYTYFTAKNGNELEGYAFSVSSNGYGGAVKVVVGIDITGKVTAIEVTDVSGETPGLGQNAKSSSFAQQFSQKKDVISVVKSNPDENEVQAITGATITSEAVANAVNTSFELYKEIGKVDSAQ